MQVFRWAPALGDDRPLIYVSFGSVLGADLRTVHVQLNLDQMDQPRGRSPTQIIPPETCPQPAGSGPLAAVILCHR